MPCSESVHTVIQHRLDPPAWANDANNNSSNSRGPQAVTLQYPPKQEIMADCTGFLDMQQNGVITYLTESNHAFEAGENLQVRLVRMDRNFARLFFVQTLKPTQDISEVTKMSLEGTGGEPATTNTWVQIEIPAEYTLTDISGGREVNTHIAFSLEIFLMDSCTCRIGSRHPPLEISGLSCSQPSMS